LPTLFFIIGLVPISGSAVYTFSKFDACLLDPVAAAFIPAVWPAL